MPENSLKIADWLTTEAKNDIALYTDHNGDLSNSFTMVAQLWSIWLTNTNVMKHLNPPSPIHLDATDVAEMLSLMTKAGKIYGGPKGSPPHTRDLLYTALAGELALAGTDGDPFLKDKPSAAPSPEPYARPSYADQLEKALTPKVKPT